MNEKTPSKKWHGIVERTAANGNTLQHWYFSIAGDVCFISGYREYRKQPDGTFAITARYYPAVSPALPNCIGVDSVPLPEDVLAEVNANTDGKQIARSRAEVSNIRRNTSGYSAKVELISFTVTFRENRQELSDIPFPVGTTDEDLAAWCNGGGTHFPAIVAGAGKAKPAEWDGTYRCPKCKRANGLSVTVTRWAKLIQKEIDNFETDIDDDEVPDHDTEWGDESSAVCSCGWHGKVADLKINGYRTGDRVYWTDPSEDLASGPGTITHIQGEGEYPITEDTVIALKVDSGSEAEVLVNEIRPIGG